MKVSLPILLVATVGSLALHTAMWWPWPEQLPWLKDLLPEKLQSTPDERPASSVRVLPRQTPPEPKPTPAPAAPEPTAVRQTAQTDPVETLAPKPAETTRLPSNEEPESPQPLRLDVSDAEATLAVARALSLSIVLGHEGSLWRIELARSSTSEAIAVAPVAPGSVALHRLPTHTTTAPAAYQKLLANATRLADVPANNSLLAMLEDAALQRAVRQAQELSQSPAQKGSGATNGRVRFASQPQARLVWIP